jgi:murein L,D-transpeptidase YcbB/YkuD
MLLIVLVAGAVPALGPAQNNLVREWIAAALLDAPPVPIILSRRDALCSALVPGFYEARQFQPAWSAGGRIRAEAWSLRRAILGARAEGLEPADYHLERIEDLAAQALRPAAATAIVLADLDLLLTDAFFVYGAHLLRGKVDPDSGAPDWSSPPPEANLPALLESALAGRDPAGLLACLAPQHPFYRDLKRLREGFRAAAAKGGWGSVPPGPDLKPGDRDRRVRALRERLAASGDLAESEARPGKKPVFDAALTDAVKGFQARHGLAPTGTVDAATLADLNVPAAKRLEQVEANLERWRWLRHELGPHHILVNTADFMLDVVKEGRPALRMKIVAGMEMWPTPAFSADMAYLVLNPYWNTPPNVLAREIIHYIRDDKDYLARNGMRLLRPIEGQEVELDPREVDWRAVDAGLIGFRVRQDPGPANVLGRIKFMLPNRYDIYLHDTPYQEDFGKETRTFSHGCIRVEKPLELAADLLNGNPAWTRDKLELALEDAVDLTVVLDKRVPVHITYCTVWVGEDGTVQVRDDIYGRDESLYAALRAAPPRRPGR